MQELFVRKFWEEESIWFYIHFQNDEAIRQIELSPEGKVLLTRENPQKDESMLYDQSLKELDLKDFDFITKEEFNNLWND